MTQPVFKECKTADVGSKKGMFEADLSREDIP